MITKMVALAVLLLFPFLINSSFASTSGIAHEVVSNEKMQIYVVSLTEQDEGGPNKRVDVEVIIKNLEPNARAFNIFFVKIIDSNGDEHKVSPLLSTVLPIRIPSNDIIRGILVFPIPPDTNAASLVWEESDGSKLTVDLTKIKQPADPIPKSDWVLTPNKGRVISDGRTQLTIHDERLNESPPYYHVDISIKSLSKEAISYSATYSFVKDQDGYLYPPDVKNLDLMYNPLRQGELAAGTEIRGEILFPLVDGVSNVMFIYDEKLGRGSYFAVPEFPYPVALLAAAGTILVLGRMHAIKRKA